MPENLLRIPWRLHDDFHSGSSRQRREAGQAIRAMMAPQQVDYLRERKGRLWLNRVYPLEAR